MFVVNTIGCINNYPKYTILLSKAEFKNTKSFFYYIVARSIRIGYFIYPEYLISQRLIKSFNNPSIQQPSYKINTFNLSKFGTDYLFNKINMHLKKECTGKYPKNYIFVVEPSWPIFNENIIDKTPLKRSYHSNRFKG